MDKDKNTGYADEFANGAPGSSGKPQGWFERLLFDALRRYARQASADYLKKKYPGLPLPIIAERYIQQQARIAAVAGGVSAAVVSGAILLSGVSVVSAVGVPALAITIPAGLLTFGGELAFTTSLQIKTAVDLCNLYGLKISPDDPEDLQDIIALGLGIKGGELIANLLSKLAPQVAKQQARRLMRTGIRRWFQNWASRNLARDIARKYLAEGFLLKAVVPGFNIVLGAGWNYYATGSIGRAVESRTRLRGLSADRVNKLSLPEGLDPQLALGTALVVLMADGRASENELVAYKTLGARLKAAHPGFESEALDGRYADRTAWLAELAEIRQPEIQESVWEIAETFAILDGNVERRERTLLQQAAKRLGQKLDAARLKQRAQAFYVAPKGRGCTIAAIAVLVTLLAAACACSVWMAGLVSRWAA